LKGGPHYCYFRASIAIGLPLEAGIKRQIAGIVAGAAIDVLLRVTNGSVRLTPFSDATFGDRVVPEISRFLGIVIGMFFNEHGSPHFHAVYGEHKITVEIESGTVRGDFPGRALRLVLEWAELHKQELSEDWDLARQRQPLKRIAPLE
jgi:hypothetical protein